jgi:hypothetical protein
LPQYIVAIESYVDVEADNPDQALEAIWKGIQNKTTSTENLSIQPRVWYSVQDEEENEIINDQIG